MNRKRRDQRRERATADDEPDLDEADLAWCGDELIYVAGHTSAGFPYGVAVSEIRRNAERDTPGAGWARAKYVLRELIEREVGAISDIGWVKKIGEGLSRDIFSAKVELTDGRCDDYVVALPRPEASTELDERTRRELRLVARLRSRGFPFRLPEMVGAFPDGERLALVRRFYRGIELDLRAGRQPSVRPWEIVAAITAAIHAVPGADVEDIVPGATTRRAHALSAIAPLEGSEGAELRDARSWALEHLPPETPSTLLHGDLLGQNILLAFDGPHRVIDWEYATYGDPARDLAIVTRGARQPFQIDGGLRRLLDAYRSHGGPDVTIDQIHVHELSLLAGWYRDALAERGHTSAAAERATCVACCDVCTDERHSQTRSRQRVAPGESASAESGAERAGDPQRTGERSEHRPRGSPVVRARRPPWPRAPPPQRRSERPGARARRSGSGEAASPRRASTREHRVRVLPPTRRAADAADQIAGASATRRGPTAAAMGQIPLSQA